MNNKVVIVSAKRTAIGSFGGSLAKITAPKLGSYVIKSLLSEIPIDLNNIDEVILGNVLTAGIGQNPARQAAIYANIPYSVPATTINVVCGSGLRTVQIGYQQIMSGMNEIIIAGGQESMSNAPYLLPNLRYGQKMGNSVVIDSMVYDGLTDIYNSYHMGITAENLARKYNISREMQDEFAFSSQVKAKQALINNKFSDEIVPVNIPQRKGDDIIFNQDEFVRMDCSLESLNKLKPAFDKLGTVTAGNSSGINDGAAAIMMMSENKAKELNLSPLAYIEAYSLSGCDPSIMGIGPVDAVRKILKHLNWSIDDVDLFEANEAFAVQALSVMKELDLNPDKVNVNGGAVALGHPIGASGARILVSLVHEMNKRKVSKGIATLCVGGGMGLAIAITR